jgi:hypothetical protein
MSRHLGPVPGKSSSIPTFPPNSHVSSHMISTFLTAVGMRSDKLAGIVKSSITHPTASSRLDRRNSSPAENASTKLERSQKQLERFAEALIIVDDGDDASVTPAARVAETLVAEQLVHQILRAKRHASGALATGRVNWKVAPGPTLREAHICPP